MAQIVHATRDKTRRYPLPKNTKPGEIVTLEEVRTIQAKAMGERRELQPLVMQRLASAGWRAYHTHNSQRSEPGFPDIVAFYDGALGPLTLLIAELKTESGKVTLAQRAWMDFFGKFGSCVNMLTNGVVRVEAHIWRPSDLLSGEIDAVIYAPTGLQIAGKRGKK